MNNKAIVAIAAVLVIALGIQTYAMFRLNNRLNQLAGQDNQVGSLQIKIPKLPQLPLPKPNFDDNFFKDHSWNPYEEIQHMQNEMEQIFGNALSRFHMNSPLGSLSKTPDIDLQEQPDQYIITVNVPGADESSLNVKLEDRRLSISVKTEHAKDEADEKNEQYRYRERFIGEFQRVLTLPGPANAAKMTTDFYNGVLTITIPKA
jgi:HSP20 family protein